MMHPLQRQDYGALPLHIHSLLIANTENGLHPGTKFIETCRYEEGMETIHGNIQRWTRGEDASMPPGSLRMVRDFSRNA